MTNERQPKIPDRATKEYGAYMEAQKSMIERNRDAIKDAMLTYPEYVGKMRDDIDNNAVVFFLIKHGVSQQWRLEFNASQELTLDIEALKYRPDLAKAA